MKLASAPILIALASSAAWAAPALQKPTELRFANVPWHLALSLGDMERIEGFPSRPDRDVFTYSNGKGTILSLIVENAHSPATLDGCRDVFARRKEGMQPINEAQGQRGEAATQEYDMPLGSREAMVFQHNVYSCRVRGTYYIDVHASGIRGLPGNPAALWALIDGVKIVD
jgi:hypothetical protein